MPQFSRYNALDQLLDIAGSPTQTPTRTLTDESGGLGAGLSGQTGVVANITVFGAGLSTLTGLTGMTANSVGNFLTVSGAASAGNNGTFLIAAFISAVSVQVANAAGVAPDANNAAITWTERRAYSLLDDLDVERSDRQLIKGVAYDAAIPTYSRPTATATTVSANLANIATKTTDAMARSVARGQFNWAVERTLTDLYGTGAFQHAATLDITGVPVFDTGFFTGDWNSCFVGVTDQATGNELEVQAGPQLGERIFGVTYNGASTSPNNVEVRWYSCANGGNIATSSTAYVWEQGTATAKTGTTSVTTVAGTNGALALTGLTAGGFVGGDVGTWLTLSGLANGANNGTFVIISVQSGTAVTVQNHGGISEGPTAAVTWTQFTKTQPTFVNLSYGYNQRLDQLDQNAWRFPAVSGLVGDADLRQDINDIQATIGSADNATSLVGLLTNTGSFFPFVNLPDATPSVVEALNTLNAQIGNRTYTPSGPIITSGQTVTASLQALQLSIGTSSRTRYIERLAAAVNANTAHTLPGGATYVLDGTNNGLDLWVWWRGVLRDPGTVVNGDDYAETSTTQITPYSKINLNEHINYIL